ncbi:hypothetical protein Dtox_3591 [Desulfofarcimen acetoxidans DSM 771]|uniref:Uncharacterized protein n=1 Tax=Desulfofarcimen acetoxidans (strain ATCC 49208 / DSM 771 / KCTC 5769 / VKM B-1644 / 5575) TaxID=485916 RepID=C8VW16_DESAS|nr:hypothetical protein Dtox_3591 [Desulfofarcimen acetoxidans DSM 771]
MAYGVGGAGMSPIIWILLILLLFGMPFGAYGTEEK